MQCVKCNSADDSEVSAETALLKCGTCNQTAHAGCVGLTRVPVGAGKDWVCPTCFLGDGDGAGAAGARFSARKRTSRFTMVEGHVILKANRYDLESGEKSVFDQELKEGSEDEAEQEFEMPSKAMLKKLVYAGVAYLSTGAGTPAAEPGGGPRGATRAELGAWAVARVGAPTRAEDAKVRKMAEKIVEEEVFQSKLLAQEVEPPSFDAIQFYLWPEDPELFQSFAKAVWSESSDALTAAAEAGGEEEEGGNEENEEEKQGEEKEGGGEEGILVGQTRVRKKFLGYGFYHGTVTRAEAGGMFLVQYEEDDFSETLSAAEVRKWRPAEEGDPAAAERRAQQQARRRAQQRRAAAAAAARRRRAAAGAGAVRPARVRRRMAAAAAGGGGADDLGRMFEALRAHGYLEGLEGDEGGFLVPRAYAKNPEQPGPRRNRKEFFCPCGKAFSTRNGLVSHAKDCDNAEAPLAAETGGEEASEEKTGRGHYAFAAQNREVLAAAEAQARARDTYLACFRAWLGPFVAPAERARLEALAQERHLKDSERPGVLKGYLTSAHALAQPEEVVGGLLRPYQLEGISWMVYLFSHGVPMILGDEMGLGKTLQTISFIAHLKYTMKISGPHLIVCPLSVLSSWFSEFKRWCPSLKVIRLHSSSSVERENLKRELAKNLTSYDAVVTTYEMVLDMNHPIVWRTVVLDEGHKIKNDDTRVAKKMRAVRSQARVILSGTPLQNTLRELWALLNWMLPHVFKSPDTFENAFNLTTQQVDADTLAQAHYCLKPFLLRRLKTEVEENLPPKRVIDVKLPLSEAQRFWYKAFIQKNAQLLKRMEQRTALSNHLAEPEEPAGSGSDWQRLNSLMTQLRKVANHPFLIKDADPFPGELTEELVAASAKMEFLDRLLTKLKAKGHRVVVFSAFTTMLDILEDYLALRGHRYFRLDGGTNRVQRTVNVGQFQKEGSKHFLFMMTTRAGGLGITLTKADTVILYDSDWNPQVDLQAMDRVHRIGQTKPVHVYRLVTAGTVEERMVLRAQKKLYLDKMVNRGSTQMADELEKMDTKEMLRTLRFGCNAIMDGNIIQQMTDKELDALIDRPNTDEDSTVGENDTMEDAASFDVHQEAFSMNYLEGEDISANTSVRDIAQTFVNHMKNKRKRQERFMNIDGHTVLRMNNYTLENGEPSVFQRECSKKYKGLENKQNRTQIPGRDYDNEDHCLNCWDGGDLVCCDFCPAAYHRPCLGLAPGQDPVARVSNRWQCPQHACHLCDRGASHAGGLLFACVACPLAYCDDCLPHGHEILNRCRRHENLGCQKRNQVCYVWCSEVCKEFIQTKFPAAFIEHESDSETDLPSEKNTPSKKKRKSPAKVKVNNALELAKKSFLDLNNGRKISPRKKKNTSPLGERTSKKNRTAIKRAHDYRCGQCGQPKKGHVCLNEVSTIACMHCLRTDDEARFLLCEKDCGKGAHFHCDGLAEIPEGAWFCRLCRAKKVYIAKGPEGLGINIQPVTCIKSNALLVIGYRNTKEGCPGMAEQIGAIKPGDQIVSVDGYSLLDLSLQQAAALLSTSATGHVVGILSEQKASATSEYPGQLQTSQEKKQNPGSEEKCIQEKQEREAAKNHTQAPAQVQLPEQLALQHAQQAPQAQDEPKVQQKAWASKPDSESGCNGNPNGLAVQPPTSNTQGSEQLGITSEQLGITSLGVL